MPARRIGAVRELLKGEGNSKEEGAKIFSISKLCISIVVVLILSLINMGRGKL